MGLFGNLFGGRKQQAPWYAPLPENTPALPGDSFEQAFKPYATNPDQGGKPGAFSQGGKAWQILGIIGDGLQTAGGGQATFTPALLDLQQRTDQERRQLAAYSRKREDDWTDFQRQHDYEVTHPKPINNDTVNDYNFIAGKLGPDVANQYLRNLGDPTVTVPMGENRFYSGPRSGMGAALGGGGASASQMPRVTDEASYNAIPPGAQYTDPNGHVRTKGGAAPSANRPFSDGGGFVPPARIGSGQMTSGRRTVEGNRAVGGVANSVHLTPNAADYWGSDLPAVLREVKRFPGLKRAFIHDAGSGKHVHAEGQGWNTPYFGRRGAAGAR